jgi:hypothetical protein
MLYFEPYEKDKFLTKISIPINLLFFLSSKYKTISTKNLYKYSEHVYVFVEQNLCSFETHKYIFKYYKSQEH